jgi:hypothetical protein
MPHHKNEIKNITPHFGNAPCQIFVIVQYFGPLVCLGVFELAMIQAKYFQVFSLFPSFQFIILLLYVFKDFFASIVQQLCALVVFFMFITSWHGHLPKYKIQLKPTLRKSNHNYFQLFENSFFVRNIER